MSEKCVIKITDINGNTKDLVFNFADEVKNKGDVKKNTLSYLEYQCELETDNGPKTVQSFSSVLEKFYKDFYISKEYEAISSIELPNDIKVIDKNSFNSLSNLRGVIFPKNVDYIDTYAFSACWPEAVLVEKDSVVEKFFKNKEYVKDCIDCKPDVKIFYDRKEYDDFMSQPLKTKYVLELIDLDGKIYKPEIEVWPNDIKEREITYEIIKKALDSIGLAEWQVKTIKIPEGITGIGNDAISGLVEKAITNKDGNLITKENLEWEIRFANLESIELPDSLIFVGAYSFRNLKSLKTLEIPKNVRRIYRGGFGGCTGLTSIKINNTTLCESFSICPNIKYVFVEKGTEAEKYFKEKYKNENGNQNSNVKLIYDLDEFNKLVDDLKKNTPVTKPIIPDQEKHKTQSETQDETNKDKNKNRNENGDKDTDKNKDKSKDKNHDDEDKIISYSKAFDLKFFLTLPTIIVAAIILIYNLYKIKNHNKRVEENKNKNPFGKIPKTLNQNQTNTPKNKNDGQIK